MSAAIPETSPASVRSIRTAVVGLGLTSLIGWGTTFSPLQILGRSIGTELGLSPELVFAGITIMMLTSALLAPRLGRRIDRDGGRNILAFGSGLMALGMIVIALSQGFVSYALGWLIVGVAVPFALTSASVPALVQIAGSRARRAVTALTIVTGVTSTVFMPLSAWLEAKLGWRHCFLVFAGMHLLICLPVHLFVLPRGRPPRQDTAAASSDATWDGLLPADQRRTALWLIALWTSIESLVVWGFNIQAINVFMAFGLIQSAAIAAWIFSGPSQALMRAGELFSGSRHSIYAIAFVSAILAPIGFVIVLSIGATSVTATLMAVLFGCGLGLYSIARQIIPLRLFGIADFGSISGQLTLPQNVATAFAPLLFAFVLGHAGPEASVALALLFALIALLALLALIRVARAATPPA
jgi:MFS family permease